MGKYWVINYIYKMKATNKLQEVVRQWLKQPQSMSYYKIAALAGVNSAELSRFKGGANANKLVFSLLPLIKEMDQDYFHANKLEEWL